jgi:hypothetical protein
LFIPFPFGDDARPPAPPLLKKARFEGIKNQCSIKNVFEIKPELCSFVDDVQCSRTNPSEKP